MVRQKINVTIDCPNSTKICLICWRCSYIYIVLFDNLSLKLLLLWVLSQTLSFFKKYFLTAFTNYSIFWKYTSSLCTFWKLNFFCHELLQKNWTKLTKLTLSILRRNPTLDKVREMPIVGGTGVFRYARDYALAKTFSFNQKTGDAVIEYNVSVLHFWGLPVLQ